MSGAESDSGIPAPKPVYPVGPLNSSGPVAENGNSNWDKRQDIFKSIPLVSPLSTPIVTESVLEATNGATIGSAKPQPEVTENLPDALPKVECIARARIPTTQGPEIFLHLYKNNVDSKEHLAIVFGEQIRSKSLFRRRPGDTDSERMTRGAYIGKLRPGRTEADVDRQTGAEIVFGENGEYLGVKEAATGAVKPGNGLNDPILVRIHSECYTGETAWSARCDCGEQFDEAGRLMGKAGFGCIVYLRQEGRGIGLGEKLKAYNLQDLGADTVQANLLLRHPADARSFSLATAILLDLGLAEIKLLTNNPDKISAVEGKNREVKVVERIPMVPLAWQSKHGDIGVRSKEVDGYLRTKIERMGHLLQQPVNLG